MAFVCFAFAGCSSDDDDPVVVTETNCISYNGKVCYKLASAFAGGGIANPSEGASHRFNAFTKEYTSYPDEEIAEPELSIERFSYADKQYAGNGDDFERIILNNIPEIGTVNIKLNQGVVVAEDANNTRVSAVTVHSYNHGTIDDKGNRSNANIHITITLDTKNVIDIKYTGKVRSDGLI